MRPWQYMLQRGAWKWLERLGGRNTAQVLAEARQPAGGSVRELEDRRAHLLNDISLAALADVPFYEKATDVLEPCGSLSDLSHFPIISKDNLRASAEAFISKSCEGAPGQSVSGGSTGAPVTSFNDSAASEIVKAAMIEGRAWWDIHPWSRCLSIWGHSKYIGQSWKGRIKLAMQRFFDALANRRVIPAYDLSKAAVLRFNQAWHKDKPDYLLGYASALYEVARVHRELGLPIPEKKCLIMTTGEVLHDWQAEVMEEVLGCRVFEEYGLVEAGAVAYTCPDGDGLKVIQSHFVVEILDYAGEPVECGEEGRIVVTSLMRKHVPVIRYDTGDRAACLDEAGGFDCSHISKVQGRTYDIIRKSDGTAVPGVIFTHAVKPLQQLDRFQVVQHKLGSVVIYYTANNELGQAAADEVTQKIHGEVGSGFGVSFQRVEQLEAAKSGKYRWIRSEVN